MYKDDPSHHFKMDLFGGDINDNVFDDNDHDFMDNKIRFDDHLDLKIEDNHLPDDEVVKKMKFEYDDEDDILSQVKEEEAEIEHHNEDLPLINFQTKKVLSHGYPSQLRLGAPNFLHAPPKRRLVRSKSEAVLRRNGENYTTFRIQKKPKKSNSKNVFIQKIRGLLYDDDLRKMITASDMDLEEKINQNKELIKMPNFGGLRKDQKLGVSQSKYSGRLSNKESAKNSRIRKKLYIELLEAKISQLSGKTQDLQKNIFLSQQNLSSLNPYNTTSQSTATSTGYFKELLEQVQEDPSPKNVLESWENYKMKSLNIIPSFASEFTQFMSNSTKNFNSVGYTPLLKFFLNMNSTKSNRFLEKLSEKEKETFNQIIKVFREKNQREIETITCIKEQMKQFFNEGRADEIQINKLMKQIGKYKLFDFLQNLSKNHPDVAPDDDEPIFLMKREHSDRTPLYMKNNEEEDIKLKKINIPNERFIDHL